MQHFPYYSSPIITSLLKNREWNVSEEIMKWTVDEVEQNFLYNKFLFKNPFHIFEFFFVLQIPNIYAKNLKYSSFPDTSASFRLIGLYRNKRQPRTSILRQIVDLRERFSLSSIWPQSVKTIDKHSQVSIQKRYVYLLRCFNFPYDCSVITFYT